METIRERVIILGKYISESHATVRDAAKRFGISKSTVHKDLTQKLPNFDPAMYGLVRSVLEKNKAERHLRGGEATKKKYHLLKSLNSDDADAVRYK